MRKSLGSAIPVRLDLSFILLILPLVSLAGVSVLVIVF
jgi:hypothetical protein